MEHRRKKVIPIISVETLYREGWKGKYKDQLIAEQKGIKRLSLSMYGTRSLFVRCTDLK